MAAETLEIRFFEIFDKKDNFYKTMVGVFTAIEDINSTWKIMELIRENDINNENVRLLIPLFKMQVGIFKECSELIYCNLFNENLTIDNSFQQIQKFKNFDKIIEYKKKLDEYDAKLKNNYSRIRNYSFHYNNHRSKANHEVASFFETLTDFGTSVKVGETMGDSENTFVFDVYFRYCNYILNNNKHSEDTVADFKRMIDEMIIITELIFNLLTEICSGYLSTERN